MLQARIAEMGAAISRDYAGQRPLFVGVLKGVLFFMADLLRSVHIPVEVDFMAISSYSPETREHGLVRITKDLETSLEGRHLIFVEDMIDTGLTLGYLLRLLSARATPPACMWPSSSTNPAVASSTYIPAILASVCPISSWWAMGWITANNTATCHSSAYSSPKSFTGNKKGLGVWGTSET